MTNVTRRGALGTLGTGLAVIGTGDLGIGFDHSYDRFTGL